LSNRIQWLMKRLNKQYPQAMYLYIAEHKTKKNLYKVGVSERPQRRETQIEGLMYRQYLLERNEAFDMEANIHEMLTGAGLHSVGEWFWLKGNGYDFVADLPDEEDGSFMLPVWA